MTIQTNTAQYRRWKSLIENDKDVSTSLDASMLDKMEQGNGIYFPLNEIPALGATEDVICAYCGKPTGDIANSLALKEFYEIAIPGGVCWVPPYCDDCK